VDERIVIDGRLLRTRVEKHDSTPGGMTAEVSLAGATHCAGASLIAQRSTLSLCLRPEPAPEVPKEEVVRLSSIFLKRPRSAPRARATEATAAILSSAPTATLVSPAPAARADDPALMQRIADATVVEETMEVLYRCCAGLDAHRDMGPVRVA